MGSIKVYSIGVDGLEPTLIDEYINNGKSHGLKYIHENSYIYKLYSTEPPMSPLAWSSIITGLSPIKHGVFDFYKYNKFTNNLNIVTRKDLPFTIFDIMNSLNVRQLLINIPFFYPPKALNGIVVSGLPAPSNSIYTYPKKLGIKLMKENISVGEPQWSLNKSILERSILDRSFFITRLIKERTWDFLMTVYRETDIAQHFFWDDRYFLKKNYKLIDESLISPILDEIVDKRQDAVIMIYGDHGFSEGKGVLNILNLLYNENLFTFNKSINCVMKTKLLKSIEKIYSTRMALYLMNIFQGYIFNNPAKYLKKIVWKDSPLSAVGSVMDGGGFLYLNPKFASYKRGIYKIILEKLYKYKIIRDISILTYRRKIIPTYPDYRISLPDGYIYYPFYSGNEVSSNKVPPARRGTHRRETRLYFAIFKKGEFMTKYSLRGSLRMNDVGSLMLYSNHVIPPDFLDGYVPNEIKEIIKNNFSDHFKSIGYREYIKYKAKLALYS